MLDITKYSFTNNKIERNLRIVLIADLHNIEYKSIIAELKQTAPNLICFAGDLANRYTGRFDRGLEFLRECNKIAPTFFSLGNHDVELIDKNGIYETGTIALDNEFVNWHGLTIGGLTSDKEFSDLNFLQNFSKSKNYKLLLCHHPEYYPKFLKNYNIDLVLSGHSHGGQWRFFGRGIYAPGQGWLPKLTSGVHFGNLVISRGLGNVVKVPRIFNNPEIVVIDINSK